MERVNFGIVLKLIAYIGVFLFILHIVLAFLRNCLPGSLC